MSAMVSQITGVTIVFSTVCSGADQRKRHSASLTFVRGIHRWPLNSPHKWPVTRKMFPFDDVFMIVTIQWVMSSGSYNWGHHPHPRTGLHGPRCPPSEKGIEAEEKWQSLSRPHFQPQFLEWKWRNLNSNFTESFDFGFVSKDRRSEFENGNRFGGIFKIHVMYKTGSIWHQIWRLNGNVCETKPILPSAAIGADRYCRRSLRPSGRPSVRLSVPNDVTALTLEGFQLLAWNLAEWCTVSWNRSLSKMAMLGQFLCVPRTEIFHDRLGPGGWNWGNHITAWNLEAWYSLFFISVGRGGCRSLGVLWPL